MSKVFQAMDKARRERLRLTEEPDLKPPAVPRTSDGPAPVIPGPAPRADLRWAPPAETLRIRDGKFGAPDPHLVSLVAPTSIQGEQYRTLRHTVEQHHEAGRLQALAVTSPAHGDGKTLTTLNLAGALAQRPHARVLVVDTDLRQPSIARYLKMNGAQRGLSQLISDPRLALEDAIHYLRRFNLYVLGGAGAQAAPYEVLSSPRFESLSQELRQHFDYILYDAPPLTYPDSRLLSKHADGFLLVVTANRTPRALIESALDALDSRKLVGLVYNGDHRPMSGYYYGRRPPKAVKKGKGYSAR